ncbi:putative retrotransposon hot spot (RHS) protein [Trypanosoma cruzi]|uniref:Putative retrotransposon hot spot (RHS) protein n=1 Tax=Trypanosoma cruzi TaxID=5693 RepID=A0A2V2WK17_TRYCR|nr:putative retrotransposon hot spot (RHS) protein [Trypanosoma cruzi]
MYGELVSALVKELNELRSSKRNEAQDSVLKVNHQGHPTRTVGLTELQGGVTRIPMEYGVLYLPAVENFPLVDGFFFVDSPRRTLVGLQMNTAGAHHTITSTVWQFYKRLAEYFDGWEEFAQGLVVGDYLCAARRQHNDNEMAEMWSRQSQKFERR